jgi:hypothetical protein
MIASPQLARFRFVPKNGCERLGAATSRERPHQGFPQARGGVVRRVPVSERERAPNGTGVRCDRTPNMSKRDPIAAGIEAETAETRIVISIEKGWLVPYTRARRRRRTPNWCHG